MPAVPHLATPEKFALMQTSVHIPVMPSEILEWADPMPGQRWIDGTGGGGGHARLLLDALGTEGQLLVVERDPAAAGGLRENLPAHAVVRNGSYHQIPEILQDLGWPAVHGILLDLGLSSDQLSDSARGFSFQSDGDLDMRFDPNNGQPAWQWLAHVDQKTLADTIFQFGEERFSRRIARRIVETRKQSPLRTASQLRELIYSCVPRGRPSKGGSKHGRVDPATRTFQALRIAVNQELSILKTALHCLPDCLAEGGRLLVISFHSLEDRLVKHAFKEDQRLEVLTRKPLQPTPSEISANPRSRSAKLRVAQRVHAQGT
jgi:16S rRNA (cytosine1402-N4)-methyltransferase